MQKIFFISIVIVSIFSCCKKKNITEESTEYFNANINGKYWTYTKPTFSNNKGIYAQASGLFYYYIGGTDVNTSLQTSIRIFFKGSNQMPTTNLHKLSLLNYAEISHPYQIDSGQVAFRTDSTHIGEVTFSKLDKNLVQGTFYFDVLDVTKNEVIHITNGKFSIIPQ